MSDVLTRSDRWAAARAAAEVKRDEVCEVYLACFSTPAGQRVLADLEALVMAPVILPDQPEAVLRDHMGQKRLFGIIMERIEHARRNRAAAGTGSAAANQPARTVHTPRRGRRVSTG